MNQACRAVYGPCEYVKVACEQAKYQPTAGILSGNPSKRTLAWLITCEGNVELAIFRQTKSFTYGLGKLLVAR